MEQQNKSDLLKLASQQGNCYSSSAMMTPHCQIWCLSLPSVIQK